MKLPRNAHLEGPRLQQRVIPADIQRTTLPAEPVAAGEPLHHPRLRVEPRVFPRGIDWFPRERGDERESRPLEVENLGGIGRGDGEEIDVAPGCAIAPREGEDGAILGSIELGDEGCVGGDGEEFAGKRGELEGTRVVEREETAGAEEAGEENRGGVGGKRLHRLTSLQREELERPRAESRGKKLLREVHRQRQHAPRGGRVLVVAEGEGGAACARVAEDGGRVHADAEIG